MHYSLTLLFISIPLFLSAGEQSIDFRQVFRASPLIYTTLFCLSMSAMMISIYTFFNSRLKQLMPHYDHELLGQAILRRNHSLALKFCEKNSSNIFNQMLEAGIRHHVFGHQAMIEAVKRAGAKHTILLWQKVSLLNDIATVAPMLGLLGTISGMFYAFYDLNRSLASIQALFDGLGISIGTTLAGLIVAILSIFFFILLKYRLIRLLTIVENEALSYAMRLTDESYP